MNDKRIRPTSLLTKCEKGRGDLGKLSVNERFTSKRFLNKRHV
jgi:hypothetical protein